MCNARLPMADCTAGWCWLCYWLCAGKPSAALHGSKCVVFHSAPGEGTQLARAAAVAAAGEQVVGIAQKYAAALREAGLEAGHVVQFAHAQQLVFAGIDNDRRRAPHARSAGKIIVSQWEEPAVVRFVESGSSRARRHVGVLVQRSGQTWCLPARCRDQWQWQQWAGRRFFEYGRC